MTIRSRSSVLCLTLATAACLADPPRYTIVDMGRAIPADSVGQGFGISPGGVGFGRSAGTGARAFSWTNSGGLVAMGAVAGRSFTVANGANDSGLVAGNATTTLTGASSLGVIWTNSVPTLLDLPAGQSISRATDVNEDGVACGSVGSGSGQRAAIWDENGVQIIPAAATGPFMTSANRLNDDGLVVGNGNDPALLSRNVGLLYDHRTGVTREIPGLASQNGAILWDVAPNGLIAGVSSFNQTDSRPFIWSESTGSVEIPLPTGASQGGARGINSDGWVVGTASGVFAVPFLYDGTATYRLQDLIPSGTGWDLASNTSSSAIGISENGTIVGTGLLNGAIRAYAMIREAPACAWASDGCVADYNNDDGIDGDDVIAFFADWDSAQPCADADGSQGVDGDDVIAFFATWDSGGAGTSGC